MEAACATCARKEHYAPSEWFTHIQWLYNLQRGGYPFGRDDLSLAEWMSLGEMTSEYDAMRAGVGSAR